MQDDHQAVRDKYHIIVEGDNLPPPGVAFEDFKLPRPVLKQLASKGIERPTPIQMQVLPAMPCCSCVSPHKAAYSFAEWAVRAVRAVRIACCATWSALAEPAACAGRDLHLCIYARSI